MLEIREICKTYRAKSGVTVKALDNVTLTFPERGMVFLLGKSGSGKSTLLNVIGGLDTYDSGELVIRGKSSKLFRRSDFDSYRNTFIGFIFQEYNILDEFSVGANIGLALELQGQRATEERINEILAEVDLAGFGNRKPNELSGGQKQRVAIARALIKDPQIIMADEPTGALDSATGEQVLETLKKLSADKLVIVVSHDREFAETYGDRIIELADGRVTDDISFEEDETAVVAEAEGMQILSDTHISIPDDYVLTSEDLAAINSYLASHKNDITISRRGEAKKREKVTERARTKTGEVKTKTYTEEDARFIRSRLPMKKAARMGLSSIKSKPIRLMFTIVLSLVAFSLFGFADTAIAYKKANAVYNTIRDMEEATVAFTMLLRSETTTYDAQGNAVSTPYFEYYTEDGISDEDVRALEQKTGIHFYPVYNGVSNGYGDIPLDQFIADRTKLNNGLEQSIFQTHSAGITEMTGEDLAAFGFSLVRGALPQKPGEILISSYYDDMFRRGGFQLDGEVQEEVVGKTLPLSLENGEVALQIVGVVDTHFDYDRYPGLQPDVANDGSYKLKKVYEVRRRLENDLSTAFHSMLIAAPGTIELLPPAGGNKFIKWGESFDTSTMTIGHTNRSDEGETTYFQGAFVNTMVGDPMLGQFDVRWYDKSENKTTLTSNDYVISIEDLMNCISIKSEFLWDVSPLAKLEEKTAPNVHYDLSEHFRRETDGFGTSYYAYAKQLEWSDEKYEEALAKAFNERFSLNLSPKEYYALATQPAGALQNVAYYGGESAFGLYAMRRVYADLADEAFMNTVLDNVGFYKYFANQGYAEENDKNIRGYLKRLTDMGQLAPTEYRAFIANHAAKYMADRRGEAKAIVTVFGYDVKSLAVDAYLELFYSLTEKQRTLLFRMEYIGGNYSDPPRVVNGVYIPKYGSNQGGCVISKTYYTQARAEQLEAGGGYYSESVVTKHTSGKYGMVMCAKPTDSKDINALASMHMDADSPYVYRIFATAMETIDMVNELIVILDKVFLGVGIFFALFASLMMFNFISASITNKKREIGILRAVGARSRDVFLIFFTEAFFVAVINFVLSASVSFAGITAINLIIRNSLGFKITLFSFGIRQVLVLLAVSIGVAFVSSFLPTNRIARKTPIDAMRDR